MFIYMQHFTKWSLNFELFLSHINIFSSRSQQHFYIDSTLMPDVKTTLFQG